MHLRQRIVACRGRCFQAEKAWCIAKHRRTIDPKYAPNPKRTACRTKRKRSTQFKENHAV